MTLQIVLPVNQFCRWIGGSDLNDKVNSTGRVDRFEFFGFLTRGSEPCGALFKDGVERFFRHEA